MSLLGDGLLVLTGAVAASIVYLTYRNRRKPGATPLAVIMVTIVGWALAHLFAHYTDDGLEQAFETLQWAGLIPLGFLWLVFVLEYVGYGDRLTRPVLAAVGAWPGFMIVGIWVPQDVPVLGEISAQFMAESGLLYWSHIGLSYGLLLVGTVLLIHYVRSQPRVFRLQAVAILCGLVAGWGGSVIAVFELLGEVHLHSLPLGFTVLGVCMLWAILRQDLTRLSPIERKTIMESLSVGVVTIDGQGRITSVNPAARRLLGLYAEADAIGRSIDTIETVPEPLIELVTQVRDGARGDTVTVERGDTVLTGEVTPLRSGTAGEAGAVLLVNDVTERRRDRQRLERQNERLERFASVVSHDLRNPLTVAEGHLGLARDDPSGEHLDQAERALSRMGDLIEDLLSLAREGEEVGELEPVDLEAVAADCLTTVDTEGATIDVGVDATVMADPGRLRQLLENLLRNPIDHADAEVSITIGDLPDGFFVADDGPGIPPDAREDVFEVGYSTDAAGTGFGLAIVREIAEAHDWTVTLEEAAAGGARFEIRGVDRVDGAGER